MSALEIEFLSDGGSSPQQVAGRLVEWIRPARASLDVAIYDFHTSEGASAAVGDALEEASSRGVAVRVVYNSEIPKHPAAPRPPSCGSEELEGLQVPTRAVAGEGALMHHKYAVRDGQSVWTGSTNWTDDAFSREENLIIRVEDGEVASAYATDFDRLWTGRPRKQAAARALSRRSRTRACRRCCRRADRRSPRRQRPSSGPRATGFGC